MLKSYDCEPTLTDRQVIHFCRDGYCKLEAAVPRDVTDRVLDFFEQNPDHHNNATPLMAEDWFVEGVVLNHDAVGAVRSLLGANFGLPQLMSNHAGKCPDLETLGWHVDGGNMHTFAVNYLQVFCLPQDTTVEMGPTQILPGSHTLLGQSALVSRYGAIRGAIHCTGPAGTIYITCYPIWHRRYKATSGPGFRHLLKYNYFRNSPPKRDWVIEPDFEPVKGAVEFNSLEAGGLPYRRNFLDSYDAARMYMWLCGLEHEFKYIGGIAWPGPLPDGPDGPVERYAVPPSLRDNGQKLDYEPVAPPMLSRG